MNYFRIENILSQSAFFGKHFHNAFILLKIYFYKPKIIAKIGA